MLPPEFNKMYSILASFLGEAKNGFDNNTTQFQFGCPRCAEKYGKRELSKYNLEVSLSCQVFHCWKCASEGDNDNGGMHGSILKLIKLYGNEELYKDYKQCLNSLRESKLFDIDFNKKYSGIAVSYQAVNEIELPDNYIPFKKDKYNPQKALSYLMGRGINWDIINYFNMGYTYYKANETWLSGRIVIPSYDKFGSINYWTGRDYTGKHHDKYFNPKVNRKDIIFNEEKIQWDADITLVEGPFDHLVVPNSIPLLGKTLATDFKLYWALFDKANANINIFLDGDAFDSVKVLYAMLNHDRLYGKIRYIPVDINNDPSSLFQQGGYKAIATHLSHAKKIKEIYLV